jgi:alkanesulfonate monooxygenase SsuD/methylene tetrahydromethanopterin reductase-like flavin-dependent oxidoreductase (luciferase family)
VQENTTVAENPTKFSGEMGMHYPLHVLNRYSLPDLIELADVAFRSMNKFGFSQVWTNDNLEYRSVLASSAAILARLPIKLGTAVTVPYFRNPVDLAMAFATISELARGQEISLGLGPGSRSILTHHVDRVKPLAIMAELAQALHKLFAGETIQKSEMPILSSYFHLNAEQYALRFKTQSPIRLYYGPSLLKPAVLDLVARHFDGVILQTLYGLAEVKASLERLNGTRAKVAPEPLRKVMLLNASVSRDGQGARQHAKRFVSHIASGWPDDVLRAKGIDPNAMEPVRRAYAENRGVDYAASLTPDHAVDQLIIAGTPKQCLPRLAECFAFASREGFTQIALGVPLGPDIREVIELWAQELLPGLRA